MVQAVRSGGDNSFLYPLGCERVEEVPADLILAIEHAHRVLSWRENLSGDDMPPSWMWHIESELDSWFQAVDERRKDGRPGGDDDEGSVGVQNEFAKGMR